MKLKEGETHRQGVWEIEQRLGYYVVREVLVGGKRRFEERVDGYYDAGHDCRPAATAVSKPVYVDSHQIHKDMMLNNLRYRDWWERNH